MLPIAEYLDPSPNPVWRLAHKCGINPAVGGLPPAPLAPGERLYDFASLPRMMQRCEAGPAAASRQSMRPTAWAAVEGDSNSGAGHASFGRLHAFGCIRGLQRAVYAEATT